ncbi:hypothetical protein MTAT_20320 [Moorella thermoacetica]|uniref:Uncharacterized protein n=1 Tax=Neomoorella thermoacetica TaxID=1525 RepID=A0AAC9HIC1_NEOTH|nr:hypothetical protein [Moorella thermoacetica]AOQ24687.1 hypothetical protein Maut_02259 [Moorella thermoacetica]TYL12790.1 hypothetical protein MTAT_20320 [Moorella thermoacetica]
MNKVFAVDIEDEDMKTFAVVLLKARAFLEGELNYSSTCPAARAEIETQLSLVDFLLDGIHEVLVDESPA